MTVSIPLNSVHPLIPVDDLSSAFIFVTSSLSLSSLLSSHSSLSSVLSSRSSLSSVLSSHSSLSSVLSSHSSLSSLLSSHSSLSSLLSFQVRSAKTYWHVQAPEATGVSRIYPGKY